jgi:hypothetical protein
MHYYLLLVSHSGDAMKYLFPLILLLTIPACESQNELKDIIEKQLKSGKIYNELLLGLELGQPEQSVSYTLDSLTAKGILYKNIIENNIFYDYKINLQKEKDKTEIQKMHMSLRFREKPDSGLYYLRLSTQLFENNDTSRQKVDELYNKILIKIKNDFGNDNWIENKPEELREETSYKVQKSGQVYQVKGNRLIAMEINEFTMPLSAEKKRSNISVTITFTDLNYTDKLKKEKDKSEKT